MKSYIISFLSAILSLFIFLGVTNKAFATPISYTLTGKAIYQTGGPDKFGFSDISGYMLIEETPYHFNDGINVFFDIIEFKIDFSISSIGGARGTSGHLKHGVHNTDFAVYGTGDIDHISSSDSKANSMSLTLLDNYYFAEMFQMTPRKASISSISLNQTPVPEPETILFFGIGITALVARKFLSEWLVTKL